LGLLPAGLLAAPVIQQVWRMTLLDGRFLIMGLTLLTASIAFAVNATRRYAPVVLLCAMAIAIGVSPTIGQSRATAPRQLFYSTHDFGERMFPAWARLQAAVESDAEARAAIVGYAGTNLPYFIAGPAQKNRVRYINVQGEADWLPHDHFRAQLRDGASLGTESAFPQWYRDRPDYEVWLRNLDALGVRWFLVARENFHGRPDAPVGPPPFPVEYEWLTSNPQRFERLGPPARPDGVEPWAIAFRVKPRVAPAANLRTN
jgi:hypothetical protein